MDFDQFREESPNPGDIAISGWFYFFIIPGPEN